MAEEGYQSFKEITKNPIYIFTVIAVAIILIVGGKLYLKQTYEVEELEDSLVVSRLFFSNGCIIEDGNVGKIDLNKFYEQRILDCTGLNEDSKQGLRLRLYDSDNNLISEIEINKELTSQCVIGNVKNIRKKFLCEYSTHYVFYDGNKGRLEVMIVNEINK